MAVLTHTINFYVVFSGLNDFVHDGGDNVISDNTFSSARDEVRTIDEVTRSPDSAAYTPIYPLDGTDISFEWWYYREAEMWTFNLWNTTSKALFANDLCQTLYNSIHENIAEWAAVYGYANYGGYQYPSIDNLNVYICWGNPLQTDQVNVLSDRQIFPFFYLGKDPEHSLEIIINEKTV